LQGVGERDVVARDAPPGVQPATLAPRPGNGAGPHPVAGEATTEPQREVQRA
jgi:hypothetical protein